MGVKTILAGGIRGLKSVLSNPEWDEEYKRRWAGEKRWARLVALWGLAALLFLAPYKQGLFFAMDYVMALIASCGICWLVWAWKLSCDDGVFISNPMDYLLLSLPVVYAISAFFSVNHGYALFEALKNVLYFMVFWAAVQVVRGEWEIRMLLLTVYLTAVILAVSGLLSAGGVFFSEGVLHGRLASFFGYWNIFANYLALSFLIGLYFWWRQTAVFRFRGTCQGAPGEVTESKGVKEERVVSISDNEIINAVFNNLYRRWNTLAAGAVVFFKITVPSYSHYLFAAGNYVLLAAFWGTKSKFGLASLILVGVVYLLGLAPENRRGVFYQVCVAGAASFFAARQYLYFISERDAQTAFLSFAAGLGLVLFWQAVYMRLQFEKDLWVWRIKGRTAAWLLLSFLIMLSAGVFTFSLIKGQNYVQGLISSGILDGMIERGYYARDALKMFIERPVIGWGGGGWEEAYRSYQSYLYNSTETHNYYLKVLVETGCIGFCILAAIWVVFLTTAFRLRGKMVPGSGGRNLVWVLTAVALVIGIHAAVDFNLSVPALFFVLVLVFACMRVISEVVRKNLTGPVDETKACKEESNKATWSFAYATIIILLFVFIGGAVSVAQKYYAQRAVRESYSVPVRVTLARMGTALKINPYDTNIRLALVKMALEFNAPDYAFRESKKLLLHGQYDAANYIAAATSAFKAGYREEAVKYSRLAISKAPYYALVPYQNYSAVCILAAREELKGGNVKKARVYLSQAADLPERVERLVAGLDETKKRLWLRNAAMTEVSPQLRYTEAEAEYLLGRWDKAVVSLKKVGSDDKNYRTKALILLSVLYERQGRHEDAEAALSEAKKSGADFDGFKDEIERLPVIKGEYN